MGAWFRCGRGFAEGAGLRVRCRAAARPLGGSRDRDRGGGVEREKGEIGKGSKKGEGGKQGKKWARRGQGQHSVCEGGWFQPSLGTFPALGCQNPLL